jgi:drug/metabolite transporter (DMT)-like permease
VVLISGALEQHGAYGRAPLRGALFGLAAGIAYVGFLLLLRRGGSDLRRVAGPLFDATLTCGVACVIAGLIIGDADWTPGWPGVGWLIVLALTSQVLGWLLITISLPRLPAAITSLLLAVQPVGTLALAALILGESPSGLQLAGVAVVMGGLLVASRPPARRRLPKQVLRLRTDQRGSTGSVVGSDVAVRAADQD